MTSARPGARRKTIGQIFGIPVLMALLSAIGLVSALVGDGMWDGVSWVTLPIPTALRLLPAA
jgi:cytosine/uracil/thiamine/allantoin permease